jgi:tetratricopeptide (TPR) repeat protein
MSFSSLDFAFPHLEAPASGEERGPSLEDVAGALRKAARENPRDPDFPFLLGQALLHERKPKEAIEWLERAARLGPADPAIRLCLGHAYLAANRPGDAASAFAEAEVLDPENAEVGFGLGAALLADGKGQAALAVFDHWVARESDLAIAHANLAVALLRIGHSEEAVGSFRQAVHLEPENPAWRRGLGHALLATEGPASALASFKHASRLDPGVAAHQLDLGDAFMALDQRPEAAAAYEAALEIDPACLRDRPHSRQARQDLTLAAIRDELHAERTPARAGSLAMGLLVDAVGATRKSGRRRARLWLAAALLIVLPAAGATTSVVRVVATHYLLRDEVVRIARISTSDEAVVRAHLRHAVTRHGLEGRLEADRCEVRSGSMVRDIHCDYEVPVDLLPGFTRTLRFAIDVNEPYFEAKAPIIL